jgi:Mg2+/Co2+ transporter CorB
MEVFFLLALILLNGAFSMSEMALVAARKGRLQSQANSGDKGSAVALELGQEPTRFLSTVQIGITSIGILNGIVGEAVLAKPVSEWLRRWMEVQTSEYAATAIVVVTITYFSIVLGELVPKRIGQLSPEAIARLVARPINWISIAAKPFVKLLSGSTNSWWRSWARRNATTRVRRGGDPRAAARRQGQRRHRGDRAPAGAQRLPPRRPPARLPHGAARRHRLPRREQVLGREPEGDRGARARALPGGSAAG